MTGKLVVAGGSGFLGRAMAGAKRPPRVWLNSSTATIYRDARDHPQDERTGEPGSGFSVDVARRWEAAQLEEPLPMTRRVALRTAMVYGVGEGGIMQTTDRVVRLGGAGAMAGGEQYVSWIHELDFCRAVQFLIETDLSGPVNVTAPHPIPFPTRRSCGLTGRPGGFRWACRPAPRCLGWARWSCNPKRNCC
ncbi:hypothetical protein [Deinococcus fonticola]|uniref:hypothetical protein n=1 Tax=Deinococcus fonticola TaxID=2528713 RepID=UPI00107563A8|nr:hypothetical protein [Deinococcus fonticola]